jgi:hypothetical protein
LGRESGKGVTVTLSRNSKLAGSGFMHCEQASAKARATGTINDIERVYMLFIMNSFLITKKKIKSVILQYIE